MRFYLFLAAFLPGSCVLPASADSRGPSSIPVRQAPPARLIYDVSQYIAAHPNDAEGYYIMGSLQAMVYVFNTDSDWSIPPTYRSFSGSNVKGTQLIEFEDTGPASPQTLPKLLEPEFWRGHIPVRLRSNRSTLLRGLDGRPLTWLTPIIRRATKSLPSAKAQMHLREAIRNFAKATELDSTKPSYWLGYAWALEEGVPHADLLGSARGVRDAGPTENTPTYWLDHANYAYKMARISNQCQRSLDSYRSIERETRFGLLRLKELSGDGWTEDDEKDIRQVEMDLRPPKLYLPGYYPFEPLETCGDVQGNGVWLANGMSKPVG